MILIIGRKDKISIHAPTRGATAFFPVLLSSLLFQSTLPQGERPLPGTTGSIPANFNPRSHKGSDNDIATYTDIQMISIHAPTRGATAFSTSTSQFDVNFNPRSHKGSDVTVPDDCY